MLLADGDGIRLNAGHKTESISNWISSSVNFVSSTVFLIYLGNFKEKISAIFFVWLIKSSVTIVNRESAFSGNPLFAISSKSIGLPLRRKLCA